MEFCDREAWSSATAREVSPTKHVLRIKGWRLILGRKQLTLWVQIWSAVWLISTGGLGGVALAAGGLYASASSRTFSVGKYARSIPS